METTMTVVSFIFLAFITSGWIMLIATPILIFLYGVFYGLSTLYQIIDRAIVGFQLKTQLDGVTKSLREKLGLDGFCSCILEKHGRTHLFTQVKLKNDSKYSHHFSGHNLEEAIEQATKYYSSGGEECHYSSQICKKSTCMGVRHCPSLKAFQGFRGDAKRYYQLRTSS